jgi:hypothetical protein
MAESDATNRDTYIAGGLFANNNFGNDIYLAMGTQGTGKGSYALFRSILRFDLTGLVGATIVDATLLLTASHGSLANETFSIHRLTQPNWTEFGANWNAYDVSYPWATLGGDFDSAPAQSLSIPGVQSLVFDQLRLLVGDALLNRGGMLDVLVKGTAPTGNQILYCYSSGDPTPSNRPTLIVHYTHPVWCVETADKAIWSVAVQDEGC